MSSEIQTGRRCDGPRIAATSGREPSARRGNRSPTVPREGHSPQRRRPDEASGLTHGGFYKQFASKDALIDEATTHAFKELAQLHSAGLEEYAGQRDSARKALIDTYLSVAHRDNPADGCPAAALAADMAREPADSEARRVYTEGVGDFAAALADDEAVGLLRLSTMLGALVLSRATKGSPLSEEILDSARVELIRGLREPLSSS